MSETPEIGLDDPKLTQRQAAQLLGVSFPTCSRYMTRGTRGVRLPSLRLGGKRLTTREAVEWFVSELQRIDAGLEASREMDEDAWADDQADLEAELAAEGL
ncbi:MAG: DUF1580 domain-containing protein [Planctomycetota bacterium]